MKQPNEKDLKQALESKDKNVVIDIALQYKWERDYFERQFKKANKALELACEFMEEYCYWNNNLLPVWAEKERIFGYFLDKIEKGEE